MSLYGGRGAEGRGAESRGLRAGGMTRGERGQGNERSSFLIAATERAALESKSGLWGLVVSKHRLGVGREVPALGGFRPLSHAWIRSWHFKNIGGERQLFV